MKISIVIITFNRIDSLRFQLLKLNELSCVDLEIIIVDNCSDMPMDSAVPDDSRFKLIKNNKNLGAVGRNTGMSVARGDIVITLDDDVYGLTDSHLIRLIRLFEDSELAAVNFSVIDENSNKTANWCHPYDVSKFAQTFFETNQISEGAVAFKRECLSQVGLYPDYFFISHEGPDLAFRIINAGWKIIYCPEIIVIHTYEIKGRPSWRRYYYDTRNQLWFVLRNCHFSYGFKKLIIGWGSMFIYSIRDGFFKYWVLAVYDSIKGSRRALADRSTPSRLTKERIRYIEKNKPGFIKTAISRLRQKEVKI